jgi:hypothetical protein
LGKPLPDNFNGGANASGKTFLSKNMAGSIKRQNISTSIIPTNFFKQFNAPENIIIEDIEKLLPQHEEKIFHIYNSIY